MAMILGGAATQDEVRRNNLSSLLRLVHARGATSRAELATATGLNRSTVKLLTADLVQAGLVRELAPVGRGGSGRPSITVAPEHTRIFVLGLDIGVEHLTVVLVGLGGQVLARQHLEQSPEDFDVTRTLGRLQLLTDQVLAQAGPPGVCVGLGVAVCGVVSAEDGVVRFAPNLGWVDVPLRDLLARQYGSALRIAIGNDGDLGAIAEHLRGAAIGRSTLVYISGEVGIGGGVILADRLMTGSGGYAGEIGHMSIDPRGRLCRCGRRGCWETEIGDQAVLESTGAPLGSHLLDVLVAYAAGEQWPRAGMRRVGRALGLGVANLVNIFNPQTIVFGGVSRHIFLATEPHVREVMADALVAPREGLTLEVAGLGEDSTVLGAAELAFGPLLADPLGVLAEVLNQIGTPA